jgi:hypothetical protein
MLGSARHNAWGRPMFHASLFALLTALFGLFAYSAARADQLIVAIAAGIIALWMLDTSVRAIRGVIRKRRAANITTDGQE